MMNIKKIDWALTWHDPKEPENLKIKNALRDWIEAYKPERPESPDIKEMSMPALCDWLTNDLRRIVKMEKPDVNTINHIRAAYADLQTLLMSFDTPSVEKASTDNVGQINLF